MDFVALRHNTIQTTSRFLNTEAALGITFVDLAKRYKETGNAERYEISTRNALARCESPKSIAQSQNTILRNKSGPRTWMRSPLRFYEQEKPSAWPNERLPNT
jgi:hypothetical protein